MLAPLRNNASRRRTGQLKPVKAPYGGWNARDDYTDMPPEDALVLDNLIPGDASVSLRRGKQTHCDGISAAVLCVTLLWNRTNGI